MGGMIEVRLPAATTFDYAECAMTKHDALKVLEEASGLVEDVEDYERWDIPGNPRIIEQRRRIEQGRRLTRLIALDRAMDVYQALANLLAGEFTDKEIAEAYARCLKRNRERGRL